MDLSWALSEAACALRALEPMLPVNEGAEKTNGLLAIRATACKLRRAVYYRLKDQNRSMPARSVRGNLFGRRLEARIL